MASSPRHLTFDVAPHLIAHLDERARFLGCSRAAYLRRLILEDKLRTEQQQQASVAQG